MTRDRPVRSSDQLGEDSSPPRTRRSTPGEPSQPPVPVGRGLAWAKLSEWIRDGRRPITIIGAPGVGKSHLARAFASTTPGALVVDLAPVRHGSSLPGVLLEALQSERPLSERPLSERPPSERPLSEPPLSEPSLTMRDPLQSVAEALRDLPLVVLDNVEHLAAPLRALLDACDPLPCPVLLTSRARIATRSEHLLELAPFGNAPDGPAAALFLELAKRFTGEDLEVESSLLAEIMHELDGLPLAIELAATWTRVLPAERLLERLRRDRFALLRERRGSKPSLYASIERSWEMLGEAEREVLRAVSVFRGPFDVDAAEAIWGAGVLDAIAGLRDASLLVPWEQHLDGGLYVPASVRTFVEVRAASEPVWHERHATYVLGLVERHRWAAEKGDVRAVHALLAARADLRSIATREEARDSFDALRSATALAALVETEGSQPGDEETLRGVLEEARRRGVPPLFDADALLGLSTIARQRGALEESRALAREALAMAASAPGSLERSRLEGQAHRRLGMLAVDMGQPRRALPRLHRACAVFASDGIEDGWAIAKSALGRAHYALGELAETWRHCHDALPVHGRHGATLWRGLTNGYLAYVALDREEMETARRHADAATECFLESGSVVYEGAFRGLVGSILHLEGDVDAALEAFEAARSAMEVAGRARLAAIHLGNEAVALLERGDLDLSAERLGRAIERLDELGDLSSRDIFRAHEAGLRFAMGELEEGHRLLDGLEASTEVPVARKVAAIQRARGALEAAVRDAAAEDGELVSSRVTRAREVLHLYERERSADIRIALRAIRTKLHEEQRTGTLPPLASSLTVSRDGTRFEWEGHEVSLAKRPVLARLLAALVEARAERPGEPVMPDVLISVTWPDERMRAESATARLHTSIGRLRRLGLGELVVHQEGGYLIAGAAPLRWLD